MILSLFFIIPVACSHGDFSFKEKPRPKKGVPYKTNPKVFKLIHEGDILLRQGTGPFSVQIVRFMNEIRPFSHCGIVCKINDTLKIIHSISPEFSSADGVQTQTIPDFFTDVADSNIAIIRPKMNETEKVKFTNEAKRLLKKQVKFDHHFEFNDSTKLYCSEFVHNCYYKSTNKDPFTLKKDCKVPLMLFEGFFDPTQFSTIWYARDKKK